MRSGTNLVIWQKNARQAVLFEKLRGTELENLEKKQEIIAAIAVLATVKVNAHLNGLHKLKKWKP
jgi:Ser/Thr protein kinase RdoA (MazF antagonist)